MPPGLAPSLEAWGNFYVIVGSSAGALTGLQFVVMTLIAQTDMARGRGESISAFGTLHVVHFCAALLVAAILSVPWSGGRGTRRGGLRGHRRDLFGGRGKAHAPATGIPARVPGLGVARGAAGDGLPGAARGWAGAGARGRRRDAGHRRGGPVARVHRDPQCLGHGDVRHHAEWGAATGGSGGGREAGACGQRVNSFVRRGAIQDAFGAWAAMRRSTA